MFVQIDTFPAPPVKVEYGPFRVHARHHDVHGLLLEVRTPGKE